MPNYQYFKDNMGKDTKFKKRPTLCIDIENVLLRKFEPESQEEVNAISSNKQWNRDYILWKSRKKAN